MRKYIIFIGLVLVILSGCGDQYDNAEGRSMATLKDFMNEYDHGDLISDADYAEAVIAEVDEKLGDYFTENYSKVVESSIRNSMATGRNFKDDPATITFFLTNSGDGFQFSKSEVYSRSVWLSRDNKVLGVEINLGVNVDNPGWEEKFPRYATVTMMKENWWDWKIDEIE